MIPDASYVTSVAFVMDWTLALPTRVGTKLHFRLIVTSGLRSLRLYGALAKDNDYTALTVLRDDPRDIDLAPLLSLSITPPHTRKDPTGLQTTLG